MSTSDALDFEPDEDLESVRDLADDIFRDLGTVERVREVEESYGGHDERLWRTLAEAGVLGIALPEEVGGGGMGMLGLTALLEQQGRRVAPVRVADVVAGAALPLGQYGDARQRERWLDPLLDGTHVVTGAWSTDAASRLVHLEGVRADDGALRVSGSLAAVPAAAVAAGVIVPVRLQSGELRVVVLRTAAEGVTITPQAVTDRGSSAGIDVRDAVVAPEDQLAGPGDGIAAWTLARLRVAHAAVLVGVCEEALAITAAYTSQRHQFGRPLSTNQGVAIRAADAYLDTEAVRLTTQRAAWLLDGGGDVDPMAAVLVAAWWAAQGGLRVVHATQHLHGGIGADVDYPIHRYFLWARQISFTLGSAGALEAELGDLLPDAPAIGAPA